jgi:ApaG protein
MKALITQGIKISVECQYESGQSDPGLNRYIFSYNVTIENQSSIPVQLLSRFWKIQDSSFMIREVEGDGVIGQQPILEPGAIHSYTSWSPLSTPIGKMSGYYVMQDLFNKKQFKVKIPSFKLIANFVLN